jgi:putative transposase
VPEVRRKMGISQATFYRWKQTYGGLMPSEVLRLRRLVADLSLDEEVLQEVVRKQL